MKKSYLSLRERTAYHRLEDVIGCKWSVAVVAAVGEGVNRPGMLERFIPGISKKILQERLRRLSDFGIIERQDLSGRVPHIEFRLTEKGRHLAGLLDQIRRIEENFPSS